MSPRIVLSGMGSSSQGLRWESASLLRIGRKNSLDVVFRDFSVDSVQAEVRYEDDCWVVRHLSTNPSHPTRVNSQEVKKSQQLCIGDVLQVGKIQLKVTELEAAAAVETVRPSVTLSALERSLPRLNTTARGGPDKIRTSGAFLRVQARANQSWDQALKNAASGTHSKTDQNQAMLTLLRANHHLVHLSNLEELLNSILQDAITALGAQRGSIALYNDVTAQLELKSNIAPGLPAAAKSCFSRTLGERCIRLGESLLCRDVEEDQTLLSAQRPPGIDVVDYLRLLRTPRKRIGVVQLDRGPLQEPFNESDLYLVDALAATAAIGIESAQLVVAQRDQFIQAMTMLARTVDLRDPYTGEHTIRVRDYALLLADEMKISAADKYQLRVGTPLHDIGKIGIDDAILRKHGKLTADEFEIMKSHTLKGAEILEMMPTLSPMISIVRNHHEKWDGSGYPDSLAGERISQTARIVAVADAFDAMTTTRPYRPALSAAQAFQELALKAGAQFDPACVEAFLRRRLQIEAMLPK